MSEIGVFMFGFVITLAIVCTAEIVLQIAKGK